MPGSYRMRRDIRAANRHMRREAYRWGQQVDWFIFDPASVEDEDGPDIGSGYDADLYDEGGLQVRPGTTDVGTPGRKWRGPFPVQVQMARIDEGAEVYSAEGTYDVDRITLVVTRQALIAAGIDPDEDRHDDRVRYDRRIFAVNHFDKRGRLADTHLTVTVTGAEVKDDELQVDYVDWYG